MLASTNVNTKLAVELPITPAGTVKVSPTAYPVPWVAAFIIVGSINKFVNPKVIVTAVVPPITDVGIVKVSPSTYPVPTEVIIMDVTALLDTTTVATAPVPVPPVN